MPGKLRRGVLAALVIVTIVLLYALALAVFMQTALTLVVTHRASAYWPVQAIVFDVMLLVLLSAIVPNLALRALHVRWIGAYVLVGAVSGLIAEYCFLFAFFAGGHMAPFKVAYGSPGNYSGPLTTLALIEEVFRRVPQIGREILAYAMDTIIVLSGIGAVCSAIFWWSGVRRRRLPK